MLIIETVGKRFAIPFRSHINPNNRDCFITDKENNAGLDFQKAVVIINDTYINTNARIQFCALQYFTKELGLA